MARHRSYQYMHYHRFKLKLREKINAAERENQVLRDLLLHNEFYKINRLGELAGNVHYDDSKRFLELEEQLAKAKAELALIDKQFAQSSPVQKIKVMREINQLVDQIREVETQRAPFRKRSAPEESDSDEVTKEHLDKQLEYELVVKKLEAMDKDFKHYDSSKNDFM